MKRKFGCLYAGWWKGIDTEGNDQVAVADFELRVSSIGFGGNFKALLQVLKKEDDDYISFRDIDSRQAKAVEVFSDMCCAKYGSFERAWKDGMKVHWDGPPQSKCYDKDYEKSGKLDEKSFKSFCRELAYPYDAKELMRTFLPEVYDSTGVRCDKGVLFFEDFGPLSFAQVGLSPASRRQIINDANHASKRDREPRFLFAGGASPCTSTQDHNLALMPPPTPSSQAASGSKPGSPKLGFENDAQFPPEPLSPKSAFARSLQKSIEAAKDMGRRTSRVSWQPLSTSTGRSQPLGGVVSTSAARVTSRFRSSQKLCGTCLSRATSASSGTTSSRTTTTSDSPCLRQWRTLA
jgi:hypothetical protein